MAQMLRNPPTMWETWVRSLGSEDPLEEDMTTHSNILAWRIPWTEEPGRLQSMGSIHKELGIIHTHNPIHTGSTLMATLPSQIVFLKAITLEMKLQHMGFQFSSVQSLSHV